MFSAFVHRHERRPAPAGRVEICPPALLGGTAASPWQRALQWLRAPAPLDDGATSRMRQVRHEFGDQVIDVCTPRGAALLERIERARSMRELWHLRPEVFDLVARHHSQDEAARRLALLNRHFPTRSPRSGFAPLEP